MAEKRGITVKVEDELHRQVREYVESRGITMADFVSQALEEMLHPKQQMGGTMENNRTIAFQVSEELYRRIKDYLTENHLTQKEFMIGLIEEALEQDLEETAEEEETEDADYEDEEDEDEDQDYDDSEEASEDEEPSQEMGM